VRAVQPLLPVLRGAVRLPAVLQDAGPGEPGLQGLPGGTFSNLSYRSFRILAMREDYEAKARF
jgi:hypothetical protein